MSTKVPNSVHTLEDAVVNVDSKYNTWGSDGWVLPVESSIEKMVAPYTFSLSRCKCPKLLHSGKGKDNSIVFKDK